MKDSLWFLSRLIWVISIIALGCGQYDPSITGHIKSNCGEIEKITIKYEINGQNYVKEFTERNYRNSFMQQVLQCRTVDKRDYSSKSIYWLAIVDLKCSQGDIHIRHIRDDYSGTFFFIDDRRCKCNKLDYLIMELLNISIDIQASYKK